MYSVYNRPRLRQYKSDPRNLLLALLVSLYVMIDLAHPTNAQPPMPFTHPKVYLQLLEKTALNMQTVPHLKQPPEHLCQGLSPALSELSQPVHREPGQLLPNSRQKSAAKCFSFLDLSRSIWKLLGSALHLPVVMFTQ